MTRPSCCGSDPFPAAGGFAVGVEDGGEIEFDVGEMKARDGVVDAVRSGIPKGEAMHMTVFGASGGTGDLGLAVLVERGALGVFAVSGGVVADSSNGKPEAKAHALGFDAIDDWLETAMESSGVDDVVAVLLLPTVVDGEDLDTFRWWRR